MKKKKTVSKKTSTRTSASWEAQEGATSRTGKEFDPKDQPGAASSPPPVEPRPVSIGLPISDSEYERLKERARSKPADAGNEIAQQDPSARRARKKE